MVQLWGSFFRKKIYQETSMKLKFVLSAALMALSVSAVARPTSMAYVDLDSIRPASAEELYNLAATDGCSAGYVDIGRPKEAKAVILTNGHCVGSKLVARMAWVNVATSKGFTLFHRSGNRLNVTATKLLYATLMDTDIAFFELKETNEELLAKGFVPFPFFQGPAPLGRQVRVTSGYWKETQECVLQRRVFKLLEGFGSDISDPSVATGALALSADCKIRGGYSGTPVIDSATNSVIAIAFTGAEGTSACAERSPCEQDPQGRTTYHRGVSYAARVDQLQDCIYGGNFNLTLPGCTLYRK